MGGGHCREGLGLAAPDIQEWGRVSSGAQREPHHFRNCSEGKTFDFCPSFMVASMPGVFLATTEAVKTAL